MQAVTVVQITYPELEKLIQDSISKALSKSLPAQDDILKIKDVAALLDVGTQTIYKYVRLGTIPFKKTGTRVYFLRNEIMEWIASK